MTAVVTAEQIEKWFSEAAARRPRLELCPISSLDTASVLRVMSHLQRTRSDGSPESIESLEDLTRLNRIRSAVEVLLAEIPVLRGSIIKAQIADDHCSHSLESLRLEAELAKLSIGWHTLPISTGPRQPAFVSAADALTFPIERALQTMGHADVSRTSVDGPFLEILQAALKAYDGYERPLETISSALRRSDARKKARAN